MQPKEFEILGKAVLYLLAAAGLFLLVALLK